MGGTTSKYKSSLGLGHVEEGNSQHVGHGEVHKGKRSWRLFNRGGQAAEPGTQYVVQHAGNGKGTGYGDVVDNSGVLVKVPSSSGLSPAKKMSAQQQGTIMAWSGDAENPERQQRPVSRGSSDCSTATGSNSSSKGDELQLSNGSSPMGLRGSRGSRSNSLTNFAAQQPQPPAQGTSHQGGGGPRPQRIGSQKSQIRSVPQPW